MTFWDKIKILGESAKFDLCGDCFISEEVKRIKDINHSRWIYPTTLPDGRKVRLLKVLLSNYCENDCAYCAFSSQVDVRRTSFSPDELARGFMALVGKGIVKGLFLSSGVKNGPERTMQELLDTAYILRNKYYFRGYIHLKVLPGASTQSIEEALKVASRVSVNLEVPGEEYIRKVSTKKDFSSDLLTKLKLISELKSKKLQLLPDGFTTQFVVGAAGERDFDILKCVFGLYNEQKLRRAYYSSFQPVPGTPLENMKPTPPIREVRLYQADYLVRIYGFSFNEIPFDQSGNLDTLKDPKLVWADRNPDFYPVEITTATYSELLRVPGIGPRTAKWIIKNRKNLSVLGVGEICKLFPKFKKALPYLSLKGKRLATKFTEQELFDSMLIFKEV